MSKPNWDDYYMVRAFWAARRSPDPTTKHGCVLVGPNHEPISEGYNGYPRGSDDANMPKTRPEKYWVTLHSEENAIFHAKTSLEGATAYITGEPCCNCWCRMLQMGVRRYVLGPKTSVMVDQALQAVTNQVLAGRKIEIVRWTPDRKTLGVALGALCREIAVTPDLSDMLASPPLTLRGRLRNAWQELVRTAN